MCNQMSSLGGGETLEQEERELGGEGQDEASACWPDFHVPGTVGAWKLGELPAGGVWSGSGLRRGF